MHSFCVHYKFYPFSYLKDLNRFNAASYSFSYRFMWESAEENERVLVLLAFLRLNARAFVQK